jgi:hypothetical protein
VPVAHPSTVTPTAVGDSATVVTLLAANEDRSGATFYNDSTALLYLKLGSGASASSFTAALAGKVGSTPGGYYETPFDYDGIVTGIWASDAGGQVLVTEITP